MEKLREQKLRNHEMGFKYWKHSVLLLKELFHLTLNRVKHQIIDIFLDVFNLLQ